MPIVIRVDSSSVIGSGHLMRCLTLAGQLKKQYNVEIYFVCRDLVGNLSYLVEEAGFRLILLPKAEKNVVLSDYEAWLTVSEMEDANETYALIASMWKSVDCLVIDSYAITATWEKRLRPLVRKIFVIDDLANRQHECDILFDQNEYLDKETRYNGLVPDNCRLILGYKHALLREEFYEAKKKLRLRTGIVKNILVYFGGSDLSNETMKVLHALKSLALKDVETNVIVGGSNPYKKEIEEFCILQDNMNYFCQVNNMAEFMAKADLAIGAGGSTIWERLFLGLNSIVISIADNQTKICEDCAQQGLIDYIGIAENVNEKLLQRAIRKYI